MVMIICCIFRYHFKTGLKFRRLEFPNFGKTVFLHKNILWYMTHMLMKKIVEKVTLSLDFKVTKI